MPKPWAAALVALLLLPGCKTLDAPASPSAEVVATQNALAADATAKAQPASASEAADEDETGVEEGAGDDAGAHPELGPLYPVVSVYDGDTIAVTVDGVKERVRIIGIDAPEKARNGNPDDCYAQESTSQMQSMVQSKQVYLLPDPTQDDRDRHDRLLRHVVLDDEGTSHAALLMVEGGFAIERQFAAPYQYQPDLLAAQDRARAAGLGLWSACGTTYAAPEDPAPVAAPVEPAPIAAPVEPAPSDRPVAPPVVPVAPPPPAAPAEPAPPATTDCVIKGNIASDGERIYHVPGQRHYDDTVISPEKGERWFCTEEEARDAGWRRAKV